MAVSRRRAILNEMRAMLVEEVAESTGANSESNVWLERGCRVKESTGERERERERERKRNRDIMGRHIPGWANHQPNPWNR